MKRKNPYRGFTLIELMVAVALVAIVMMIGVPSFQESIERNRLTTQANDFISSLSIARSEAVRRGKAVTVCKSSDGSTCNAAAAGYEVGWIIFVDDDRNGIRDAATEELLKRFYNLGTDYTLRGSSANAINNFVSYVPSGQSSATGIGKFVLCKDGESSKSRTIVLEITGRAHVEQDNSASCV
jgi:type IV fimbrial biogenesis protein FimT